MPIPPAQSTATTPSPGIPHYKTDRRRLETNHSYPLEQIQPEAPGGYHADAGAYPQGGGDRCDICVPAERGILYRRPLQGLQRRLHEVQG